MGFIRKIRACLYLVPTLAIPCLAQVDCSKIQEPLCNRLKNAAIDSTVFSIAIAFFPPPRENMRDTAYWAKLKSDVAHFFTSYDIRDTLGHRLPVPDSIDWSYVEIFAAKKTITDFVKEAYIQEVVIWEGNGPARTSPISQTRLFVSDREESGYLMNGRRVNLPERSAPSLTLPRKRSAD